MQKSNNIELNDRIEIDKSNYFDWLVKYIEKGGKVDEYYDRKFDVEIIINLKSMLIEHLI